ncbi:DUF726-domain-containing protein [Wilcoxina mikolae CBS 423.85]|nr:DUF726-domain-containing protein [Wilcoxina mikolae CBS 423.85]
MSQDGDLVSILSLSQRHELLHLIASITDHMRLSLTPATKPASPQDSSTSPPKPPSPGLLEIQKGALSSFDAWRDAVITRICSVLNSPAAAATNTPAATAIPEPTSPSSDYPKPDLSFLHTKYPPIPTPLASIPNRDPILASLLLLVLSLKSYDSRSRVLLLYTASSLHIPLQTLSDLELSTAKSLLSSAKMSADAESASRVEASRTTNRWKIGLASVAGAALIGVTGGLAAPLVAAGIGTVMGGLGLGATAAAGYLGAVAGSSAIVGALFGAYGGRMGGQMMERYAKEVEDFSFIPVHSSDAALLRVSVGVTGWIVEGEEEVVDPWKSLGGGVEAYALRWEVDALTDLGTALTEILTSAAMGWVSVEIVKCTVFAALYSALWPLALLSAANVLDNPFAVAKRRSKKAGLVLADAIINKAQGERPVTLVGYSLGARVIYTCLLSLAKRGAFGLVENVVFMGAPVPASEDSWKAIHAVVAGRVVNVFSDQDYILAFLYRTSSIQLGVAGLQEIKVEGVENVDVGKMVEGHLRYRLAVGRVLKDVLQGDVEIARAEWEEDRLRMLEWKDKEEGEKRAKIEAGEKAKEVEAEKIELGVEEKEAREVEGEKIELQSKEKKERDIDEVLKRVEMHLEARRKKRAVKK